MNVRRKTNALNTSRYYTYLGVILTIFVSGCNKTIYIEEKYIFSYYYWKHDKMLDPAIMKTTTKWDLMGDGLQLIGLLVGALLFNEV